MRRVTQLFELILGARDCRIVAGHQIGHGYSSTWSKAPEHLAERVTGVLEVVDGEAGDDDIERGVEDGSTAASPRRKTTLRSPLSGAARLPASSIATLDIGREVANEPVILEPGGLARERVVHRFSVIRSHHQKLAPSAAARVCARRRMCPASDLSKYQRRPLGELTRARARMSSAFNRAPAVRDAMAQDRARLARLRHPRRLLHRSRWRRRTDCSRWVR